MRSSEAKPPFGEAGSTISSVEMASLSEMLGWTFCYQAPLLWKQIFVWVQEADCLSSSKVTNATVIRVANLTLRNVLIVSKGFVFLCCLFPSPLSPWQIKSVYEGLTASVWIHTWFYSLITGALITNSCSVISGSFWCNFFSNYTDFLLEEFLFLSIKDHASAAFHQPHQHVLSPPPPATFHWRDFLKPLCTPILFWVPKWTSDVTCLSAIIWLHN